MLAWGLYRTQKLALSQSGPHAPIMRENRKFMILFIVDNFDSKVIIDLNIGLSNG